MNLRLISLERLRFWGVLFLGLLLLPLSSEAVLSADVKVLRVKAFLDTIAWAETGTVAKKGYHILVFNGKFSNFSKHPKIKQCASINRRIVCSTAAGRYQVMDFNWDSLKYKLKLKDFSPVSQDKIALYFIIQKGAIADVKAGRFENAVCKVGGIWASMPCGNNYGQNPKSMGKLKFMYQYRLVNYVKYYKSIEKKRKPSLKWENITIVR
ncbi:MAG TPA: glycoside hydrolase family 104 protein [Oculatellaceae cyanobacterium]